ncbi:alpha/beta fold hydrolase [Nocardia uniformis]|uniref:Alpha/beta fold hydrolase n=1 Tax=Nocardia uniformis TaxID=53432 RepID=A0A849C5W1_9NOCA|nr:alpha/beta fold hydrolase [Nocardia uniformis]NNH73086.1 alpha/beta fold hydrolase [Nocardia uniformis]
MSVRDSRRCRWGIGSPLVALAVAGICAAAAAHANGFADGSVAPQGANDWACRPTAARPEPVLLIHGTWGNQNSWDTLAPQLKAHGLCVFSLNYGRAVFSVRGSDPGVYGTADIRSSAREIAGFIDRVRTATGAAKVDIVAHSQGGPLARQYLRFEGGAHRNDPGRNTVRRLVTIAATNHGTNAEGLDSLLPSGSAAATVDDMIGRALGTAAAQQLPDSEFLRTLNAAGDTEPGIDYTAIASRVDRVVTPPEATFLRAGRGATVDNVWVQDLCPTDTFHHGTLPDSPAVAYLVHRGLDLTYPGSPCPAPSADQQN